MKVLYSNIDEHLVHLSVDVAATFGILELKMTSHKIKEKERLSTSACYKLSKSTCVAYKGEFGPLLIR